MARANLKKMQRAIEEAAGIVVAKLASERETDSAHIEAHAERSRAQLTKLSEEQRKILAVIAQNRAAINAALDETIEGIEALFVELRHDEEERLASLRAHADDINNDGEETMLESQKMAHLADAKRRARAG